MERMIADISWSKAQAKKCSSLTEYQIAQAFTDEAIEIIPRINTALSNKLKGIRAGISSLHAAARKNKWEDLILNFNIEGFLMLCPYQEEIALFQKNKRILDYARRRRSYTRPGAKPAINPVNDDTINDAKQKPILSLYSFDKLKKYGNKHMARCPFHNEDSASFFIYDNNTYHCFGCQANGTAIDFFMRLNNVNFKDAVRALSGV